MNLEVSIFWVSFFFFEYIIKRVFYYRICLYLVEKEEFYCGYFMRLLKTILNFISRGSLNLHKNISMSNNRRMFSIRQS